MRNTVKRDRFTNVDPVWVTEIAVSEEVVEVPEVVEEVEVVEVVEKKGKGKKNGRRVRRSNKGKNAAPTVGGSGVHSDNG